MDSAKIACSHGRPWNPKIEDDMLGCLQAPQLARLLGAASASKLLKEGPCPLNYRC